MTRMTRKQFLTSVAASAAAAGASRLTGEPALSAVNGFRTIADERNWRAAGAPQLFGATGLARSTRMLEQRGIATVNVVATPSFGAFIQAWMFGGHVARGVWGRATIELELDALSGYHFVEVSIADLYPFAVWDMSPVLIDGPIAPGAISRVHGVPRNSTLRYPEINLIFTATYGGQPVSAFSLELPHGHATQLS